MNSFHSFISWWTRFHSFMCYVMVLWLLLSLIHRWKRYNPIMVLSPMLYQRLHVVINHRYFFLFGLWLCCGCPTLWFYYIELHIQEYISESQNGTLWKNYYFHCIITVQQPPIRNVDYMKYLFIWCSCLVVWYYIFIWLLVLFGRCCTFFHLQGAFLRVWITFKNFPCKREE